MRMDDITHSLAPRAWAEEHFGELPFSDVRRSERAITIAEALASNPGASIPQLFAHPYDTKAAYTFFAHPEVEPDTLQATHRSLVTERMDQPGTYLLIEDTTELDWTSRERIEAVRSTRRGCYCIPCWACSGRPTKILQSKAAARR